MNALFPRSGGVDSSKTTTVDTVPIVDISVASRFHAFDLARELSIHGLLRHLHTGYPAFLPPRFGVPAMSVRSIWTGEALNRTLSTFYRRGWLKHQPDPFVSQRHDRIVASRIAPGGNLFVGWSSQCRESIAVARRLGMATVVERGSAHILWQRQQLDEERRLTGLPVELPHEHSIEQELQEYETTDFIAVPSAFSARTFINRGIPASKLLVNPYGVDLSLFDRAAAGGRGSRRAARDGLRVLHVGRVSAQKGVHYLVDAIARVPDCRLTLVGAVDPGMDRVVTNQPRIQVVGAVPGPTLPGWYGEADVFCLLSVQEGLALVIAQAMAMGLPVIATPNTGAEELITNGVNGFIVPARDPGAVAERLRMLAESSKIRREVGDRAREHVSGRFGWSHYGARARAHYAQILRDRLAKAESL
jgi:glycosyltransferase involved in cell wall biosynthesis